MERREGEAQEQKMARGHLGHNFESGARITFTWAWVVFPHAVAHQYSVASPTAEKVELTQTCWPWRKDPDLVPPEEPDVASLSRNLWRRPRGPGARWECELLHVLVFEQ